MKVESAAKPKGLFLSLFQNKVQATSPLTSTLLTRSQVVFYGRAGLSGTAAAMLRKLRHVIATGGVSSIPWRGYSYTYKNFIRPFLPNASPIIYNGVDIGAYRKYGDTYIDHFYMPPDVSDQPEYEEALVKALKRYVRPGDKTVVVGGGLGVTAVVAAQCSSPHGSVNCFEGDIEGVMKVRRTAELNGVAERLSVTHAIVGENVGVYGSSEASEILPPHALPQCDVLELDCEGSEIGILRDMIIDPRIIAVETHGFAGASSAKVRDLLVERGYQVVDFGLAETRFTQSCVEKDIKVLVGVRGE